MAVPVETVEPAEWADDEAGRVRHWQFTQFRELGFSWRACVLLVEARADHHLVGRMLERGCSRMNALKIFT